ncbi:MAG: hypothetical protein NC305_08965 [Lachnospiraceae bacterium]|nr:hypothetical protein [Butyrivibrio sp.]MCM1344351.1 hypothetical protein [Muribaculaceae bacterium]MCM1410663.1 hypothetical protein [Lachnospiraceae bacterium]
MKRILLSADSKISVFTVPDQVADHLEQYCLEFSDRWLHQSPDAARYRVKMGDTIGVRYCETDFIDYLNQYVCDGQASLVTTLEGVYVGDEIPGEYAGLPYFNF